MRFESVRAVERGLIFAAVTTLLVTACGSSGPDGSIADSRSPTILVADTYNDRIVQMERIDGAGWQSFGSNGNGIGQFSLPERVAADPLGRIYVADTGNNRIVRINNISGAGWEELGTYGTGVREFAYPNAIAVDAQLKIYVLDYNNRRIVRVDDMEGNGWTVLGAWDCNGPCYDMPASLTLDRYGRIFVGDGIRVVRFDDISGSGRAVLETYDGIDPDSLVASAGLAIDTLDRIYLAGGTKLVRFNDITGTGRITFRADGGGQGGFGRLTGVAVDANGKMYMVDWSKDRISTMSDMNGNGWVVLGGYGNGSLQFASPQGIGIR